MSIRLVLDASAILAYTKQSVAVGELVSELYEEEAARFSLPVVSMAHAATLADDLDLLMVLAHHELAIGRPPPRTGRRSPGRRPDPGQNYGSESQSSVSV